MCKYHRLLRPIIDSLNKGSIDSIYLKTDILDRVNNIFNQIDPKTTKEAIAILDDNLNDIFDFMNYPSINDMNHYINQYFEDFEDIQGSELYFLDNNDMQDLSDMYVAGIKTVLAQFISILEYHIAKVNIQGYIK